MITGMHAVVYSPEAEKVRAFFADVLGMPSADAGAGWLIFALPPAELAVHPTEGESRHELYLMCDDIHATLAELDGQGSRSSTGCLRPALGTSRGNPPARRLRASHLRAPAPVASAVLGNSNKYRQQDCPLDKLTPLFGGETVKRQVKGQFGGVAC